MLTDEEIIAALHGAFNDATIDVCPSSELVRTTCRRQRNRHRMTRIAQATLPVAVVVAVSATVIAGHGPHRQSLATNPGAGPSVLSATSSTEPTANRPAFPSSGESALDGYRLKLPISFVPGLGPASCPSKANLSAAERTRLFTAPGARCPFLVRSVLPQLPAGMSRVQATAQPSGDRVTFFRGISPDGNYNSYVQVRLSTGGNVFVLVDPLQGTLSLQQYAELADGAIATPA